MYKDLIKAIKKVEKCCNEKDKFKKNCYKCRLGGYCRDIYDADRYGDADDISICKAIMVLSEEVIRKEEQE